MSTTLQAASATFAITCKTGDPTAGRTGSRVKKVLGPLKTTLTLLCEGDVRLCLITSDFSTSHCLTLELQKRVGDKLNLPPSRVLYFTSHDHSVPLLDHNHSVDLRSFRVMGTSGQIPKLKLLPLGRKFLHLTCSAAESLPRRLEPVTVWWALGHENRISYNRKGRRADGSTFFMREEDRLLYGRDFCGDIDTEAPVVCLKNSDGHPVSFFTQFTAHPVTSYHPQHPIVHGDYPRVACDLLAESFKSRYGPVPVSFFQGCAGDVNAKQMFVGGPRRAEQYGRCLGQTYRRAAKKLRPSGRSGLDHAAAIARIPFAALPSPAILRKEMREMHDFISRAEAGDENTLSCVGLNFPRALTPRYRAALVKMILPWNQWALDIHRQGRTAQLPRDWELEVHAIRLGDVAIVGLPCEAFQGVGRLIRQGSPFPLTIPCAYLNELDGYIPDGPNTGDREYMSAWYRYSGYRPPWKKPAGNVLAHTAIKMLTRFAAGNR